VASAHLALACTWSTHIKLNSDHLPITITFPSDDAPSPRKAKFYTNFSKAEWPAFIRETEVVFRSQPPPTLVEAGEKIFRNILHVASSHCIPAGYRRSCIPGTSREATSLIDHRDTVRANDLLDPSLTDLNRDISKVIADNRHQIWRDKVLAAGQRAQPSKFWPLIRGLSGKRLFFLSNQPIFFGKKVLTASSRISEGSIRQYFPPPSLDPLTWKVRRRLNINSITTSPLHSSQNRRSNSKL
jgi:hypothetical protein